jgi:hypothetical protein
MQELFATDTDRGDAATQRCSEIKGRTFGADIDRGDAAMQRRSEIEGRTFALLPPTLDTDAALSFSPRTAHCLLRTVHCALSSVPSCRQHIHQVHHLHRLLLLLDKSVNVHETRHIG